MTPALLAIACLLAVTLGYAGKCVASPFGTCRTCHGMGHLTRTDRKGRPKRGKDCRRCHATGKRIRVGRRLYNRATATYRAGTR
ncbi:MULTISPECIES: hypothetical protein [Streptomyces]|uniref:Uncharacterized protein n=1 Tax=Streptomyces venezuelae (strain ATCC 10712 / CBS 650.69 / DSM 40230 / JCM 4526 / NBRC 13096 / PD 04745) TaxID=953739 RepID=F2RJJ8_STRVP|nr:hypothetical protein [Streptomyces venezuelae]APE21216.1 hypothetical protein vnz_09405 [Streptomyces venezuelae]QER98606.1 hypothetical protein DEJ43_09510 [Streptomyces venezuelae ATCC 10712]CCA55208.1 hypothetical protein SVEN_1921 [Streptomyces venezuelae ATCC 10712]